MPAMKLKNSAVTSSQPENRNSTARRGSVRGTRKSSAKPAIITISAAGSSQLIWPPTSSWNSRRMPVAPQLPVVPAPPPTLPVSLPVRRPRPL